jgi:hypothetical protein
VVELARKLNLPVISEDKKVLKNASGPDYPTTMH